MRISAIHGGAVRQVSTEVPTHEHQAIKDYAKSQNKSVQQLVREWIRQGHQNEKLNNRSE